MTIIESIFARNQRGQLSLLKLTDALHSAQIKRGGASAPVMNDNRRGLRNTPFLASAGNFMLSPAALAPLENHLIVTSGVAAEPVALQADTASMQLDQAADLEAIAARLDNNLRALEQIATPGHNPATTDVAAELASIAKAMLNSTRIVAEELNRREVQTRALQSSLADARRSAEIDFLTGLPNRRAFEAVLKAEVAAAQSRGDPLSVAFVDLDHFKTINDIHGHDAGDRVLKVVAQILAAISNDKCHVARHGGEEFVVLFRGKTLSAAWYELDLARQALAGSKLVKRAAGIPFGEITFSGGIADVMAHATTGAALKAADGALYSAKTSGRNRIAWASAHTAHRAAA